MIPNYRTVSITANADENVVPIILAELKAEGYATPRFTLDFVGFEGDEGESFKVNGNPLKVPSTGYFITPYCGDDNYIAIHSLTFDEAVSDKNIWIIY